MSMHTYFEYGYRLGDGREVWVEDHGTDGAWIPDDDRSGVGSVYLDAGIDAVASIVLALEQAGVEGRPLRRQLVVLTGLAQEYIGAGTWETVPPTTVSLDGLVAESRRLVTESQQERVRHAFTSVATGSVEGGTVRVVRDDTAKPSTDAWQDPAWGPLV